MKKLFYLILLPCLCACSNELDTVLEESHSGQPSENTITNHRVDQKVENPTSVFWDVYRPDDPNYSDDDDPWWGSNQ